MITFVIGCKTQGGTKKKSIALQILSCHSTYLNESFLRINVKKNKLNYEINKKNSLINTYNLRISFHASSLSDSLCLLLFIASRLLAALKALCASAYRTCSGSFCASGPS